MPATEEVVEQGKESTAGAGKGQAETFTVTKADYERVQRERDEAKQSERYWADRARGNGKREETEHEEESGVDVSDFVPEVTGNEDVDQAIFNDPEKWVAAIAKGPAAIEALIRKGGYVTGKQAADIAEKVARRTVNETTGRLSSDHAFMNRYPDLQNKESDLFKATATEYNEMLAEMTREERREAEKSPLTLRAAARTAEAKLKAAKAAAKPKADEDDFEYDRVDPEEERRQRVRAQDGSRGGRGGGGEEESRIGPQQRAVLEGMGVSEDKFRNSEKNIGSARRRK